LFLVCFCYNNKNTKLKRQMRHVDFRRQAFARVRRFMVLKLGFKPAVGSIAPTPAPPIAMAPKRAMMAQ
jgi:hypothetical protein